MSANNHHDSQEEEKNNVTSGFISEEQKIGLHTVSDCYVSHLNLFVIKMGFHL